MADVVRREARTPTTVDFFERLFDDWAGFLPMRRPWWFGFETSRDEMIRVEEYRDGETFVVRAELPGIDPEKDVEVTASEGMLHLHAERRDERKEDEGGMHRRELRNETTQPAWRLAALGGERFFFAIPRQRSARRQ
jgi:HSP20 family protein